MMIPCKHQQTMQTHGFLGGAKQISPIHSIHKEAPAFTTAKSDLSGTPISWGSDGDYGWGVPLDPASGFGPKGTLSGSGKPHGT